MNSFRGKKRKKLQFAYRLSIILTAIGSVILLYVVLGFGYKIEELEYLSAIGGTVVLVGLVCIPLISWLWMTKNEKNGL